MPRALGSFLLHLQPATVWLGLSCPFPLLILNKPQRFAASLGSHQKRRHLDSCRSCQSYMGHDSRLLGD